MTTTEKKKSDEESTRHTGSVRAVDEEFAKWIARQWRRGETVDKIDLVEFFHRGQNQGYGNVVDWESFPTARDVNQEEAVELSNRFVGSAQLNCERVHEKPMAYYARAFDRARSTDAAPVDTFVIKCTPRPRFAAAGASFQTTDDDPEAIARSGFKFVSTALQLYHRERDRDEVTKDDLIVILLKERQAEREYAITRDRMYRELMGDWVAAVRAREEALSLELDRVPQREMAKVRAEVIREAAKVGRTLLTGGFMKMFPKSFPQPQPQSQPQLQQGPGNSSDGTTSPTPEPRSQEQILIEALLRNCRAAALDIALFGDWRKDKDGKLELVAPGVFTSEQFFVLMKVLTGRESVEALDDLLMDSGKAVAITPDQIMAAQNLDGMTDEISDNLVKLMQLRMQKKTAHPANAVSEVNSGQ